MGKYCPKTQCSMATVALSTFGAKTKIALTGVHSRVRESLTKPVNQYILLQLTHFLVKNAFRQFRKYISKIVIHLKLQDSTFKLGQNSF